MSKTSKVLLIVGLVILFIGISVGMFFLGRKLKNDRKRRANELTDDNYEYSHDDYSQPINSNND